MGENRDGTGDPRGLIPGDSRMRGGGAGETLGTSCEGRQRAPSFRVGRH